MSVEGLAYVAAVALLAGLYLSAHTFEPSCVDDCHGCTGLMGMSVFAPDYWIRVRDMFRGFAVPVIYSAFGEQNEYSEAAIVYFRAVTALAAWFCFALVVSSFVTGRWRRFLVFVLIASGMFSGATCASTTGSSLIPLALSLVLARFALILKPEPVMAYLASRCGKAALPVFLATIALMTAFVHVSARHQCVPCRVRRSAGICADPPGRWGAPRSRADAHRRGHGGPDDGHRRPSAGYRWPAQLGEHGQHHRGNGHRRLQPERVLRPARHARFAGATGSPTGASRCLDVARDYRQPGTGPGRPHFDTERARAKARTFIRSEARLVYATWLVTHPEYVVRNVRES